MQNQLPLIRIRYTAILIAVYVCVSSVIGCTANRSRQFVGKYERENFSDFGNKSVYIRGGDGGDVLDLFVSTDLENARHIGPYIVSVNKRSKVVVSSGKHLLGDSVLVDTAALQQLAIKFLNYEVVALAVDKNKNVYVGLKSNEKFDLVRFSDLQYKDANYRDWKHIQANWYSR